MNWKDTVCPQWQPESYNLNFNDVWINPCILTHFYKALFSHLFSPFLWQPINSPCTPASCCCGCPKELYSQFDFADILWRNKIKADRNTCTITNKCHLRTFPMCILAPKSRIVADDFNFLLHFPWPGSLSPNQPVLLTGTKEHFAEAQHLPETLKIFQPESPEMETSNTLPCSLCPTRPPAWPSCWPGPSATQVSVSHKGVALENGPTPPPPEHKKECS